MNEIIHREGTTNHVINIVLMNMMYVFYSSLGLSVHPEGGYYRRIFTSTTPYTSEAAATGNSKSSAVAAGRGNRKNSATAGAAAADHVQYSTASSIYYLLQPGIPSPFHRIVDREEQWVVLEGDDVLIQQIDVERREVREFYVGAYRTTTSTASSIHCLPSSLPSRSSSSTATIPIVPIHTVPASTYFCAQLASNRYGYSLVSCIVTPSFDFSVFEWLDASDYHARKVESGIEKQLEREGWSEMKIREKIEQIRSALHTSNEQ